jgi:hypothetical protein
MPYDALELFEHDKEIRKPEDCLSQMPRRGCIN